MIEWSKDMKNQKSKFFWKYSSCSMGTVGIRRRVVQIFGGTVVAIRSVNEVGV